MKTALTIKQIDNLSSIIAEKVLGRSSDKPSAIDRFRLSTKERIRISDETIEKILGSQDINEAVEELKALVLKSEGRPNARLKHTVYSGDHRPEPTHQGKSTEAEKNKGPKMEKEKPEKKIRYDLRNRTIYLVGENYRKKGTKGWETMEIVRNNPGITADELEKKGGHRKHVLWDLKNHESMIKLERIKQDA